jgi:DNA-binding CsgD family transcriptional regulator
LLQAAALVADSLGRTATAPAALVASPSAPTRGLSAQSGVSEAVIACLSPRQREIVRLLAEGHPLPEVAELLDLSPHTVRGHMKTIFAKLGVQSQVALLSLVSGRNAKNATD